MQNLNSLIACGILLISCLKIPCARYVELEINDEGQELEELDHSPRIGDSVPNFQYAFSKRVHLDKMSGISLNLPREKEILTKYSSWRSRREGKPHDLVLKFCSMKLKGGCSWDESNMLLRYEAKSGAGFNNYAPKDFQKQWIDPSSLLSVSIPAKAESRCKRLNKAPSAEKFLTKYVATGTPVIIAGAVKHWKALSNWNLQYLTRKAGDKAVRIYTSLDGHYEKIQSVAEWLELINSRGSFHSPGLREASLDPNELVMVRPAETYFKFKDYVFLTTNYSNSEQAKFYFQKHDIRLWQSTGLLKDVFPPLNGGGDKSSGGKRNGWAKFLALKHNFLWLARGVTYGPIHYDNFENLYAVIRGTKTFEIFHPQQSSEMYESVASYRSAHLLYEWSEKHGGQFWSLPINSTEKSYLPFSPVNISHPNYELYPLHRNARKLTCKLVAGDVLYLPSYWWHEVTGKPNSSDDLSISLNSFFEPWWIKGSDLRSFSLNPLYSYLHNFETDVQSKKYRKRVKKLLNKIRWK